MEKWGGPQAWRKQHEDRYRVLANLEFGSAAWWVTCRNPAESPGGAFRTPQGCQLGLDLVSNGSCGRFGGAAKSGVYILEKRRLQKPLSLERAL